MYPVYGWTWGAPVLDGKEIPTTLGTGRVLRHPLEVDGRAFEVTCVSMGNPHAVIFLNEDVETFDVGRYGPLIERHAAFPHRTNVEFAQVKEAGRIRMRVWERGSGVTLACGTGACATAVAASLCGLAGRRAIVELDGGELLVEWAEDTVYKTAPPHSSLTGSGRIPDRRMTAFLLKGTRSPLHPHVFVILYGRFQCGQAFR